MTVISPGDRFGRWTVLAPSKERPCYFTCRCDCGTVKDVYRSSLLQGTSAGCPDCAHKIPSEAKEASCRKRAETALTSARMKYIGQTVNGWRILDVLPAQESGSGFRCKAVCPKCGKPTVTLLSRIRRSCPIRQCAACNRDIDRTTSTYHDVAYKDGSCLASIRSRVKGTTNRNSTTGVNGVSRRPDGRYRAYINFRRRQVNLGMYDTPEDAAAARKAAEAVLYGEYLDAHEGWETRLKEELEKLKDK